MSARRLMSGDDATVPAVPVMVASVDDSRLRDFTALTDVELRSSREHADGLFLAEGEKTIARALAASYEPRAALCTPTLLDQVSRALAGTDTPVYVAADDVVASITGYPMHRGALASFARRQLPSVAEVARDARTVVVLEDLTDHTNVGLIFRSAAALGVDAVLLAPRCADPLYRRAIRTSMGAVLTLPYARMIDWYHGLEELSALGFRTVALTPDPEVQLLADIARTGIARVALVVGSEGEGLSARWLRTADALARIPMVEGVDSLNVAAAAAIACYVVTNRAPSAP